MRFNALLVDIENKIGNITTPTHAKIQAARKAFPKLSKEELAKELETSVGYIDSVDEIYKGATQTPRKTVPLSR
jgi:DNA transposition AAA+ family ATPase